MWPFTKKSIHDVAPALPPHELRRRVRTVVVDDDADSFPTQLLKDDGYSIDWWPQLDARHLNQLERGDFDIIVLDIQGIAGPTLSDTGDGMGVLKRIKSVNEYQIVVAFSGKSYDLDSVPFWKLADETLRKPVSVIRAKEVLDRLIQDRVSVGRYWQNVEGLLSAANVSSGRIRKLEARVVSATRAGTSISIEDVKKVVGTAEVAAAVYSFIEKIIVLCRTLA